MVYGVLLQLSVSAMSEGLPRQPTKRESLSWNYTASTAIARVASVGEQALAIDTAHCAGTLAAWTTREPVLQRVRRFT